MDEIVNARRSMPAVLRRNPALRRLLAALAVSQLGDWLYNLALLAFVFGRTHSVAWTAATTCARVLPMVLLGPLGGVLADRFDRRRLMIAADALRVVMMLLLAAVAMTDLPVLVAPILAAASTAASVVYPPCVAATTARLVSADDLPVANAMRSSIGAVSVVAGPAGGALLLLLHAPAWAFAINAGTFAASALFLIGLGAQPAPQDRAERPATGVWHELREGVAALRGDTVAVRVVGADVMCSVLYGAHTVLLLMLSRRLGGGDSGYGYLLAAIGAGGLIGAAVAARLCVRDPLRVVGAMLVLTAVPAALLPVAPILPVVVLLAAAIGAGCVAVEVVVDTSLAARLDESVLARAYGLAFPASIAGIAVGSLITAPLAGWLGLAGALVVAAALVGAYAVAILLPVARWRPFRLARR